MSEDKQYPENIENFLRENAFSVYAIDAEKIAKDLGSPKVENSVILGFLSAFLSFEEKDWIEVIKDSVPQVTIDLNIKAFQEGRRLAKESAILGQGSRDIKKKRIKKDSN